MGFIHMEGLFFRDIGVKSECYDKVYLVNIYYLNDVLT